MRTRNDVENARFQGAVPRRLPMDYVTKAAVALSLRQVYSLYSGPAVRIRRSSDNAEQDIRFNRQGELDRASIAAFVGSNNAYVTTVYDQSGNGRNATQTTQGSQPQIVRDGVVLLSDNSKPVFKLDGIDDWMAVSVNITVGHTMIYYAKKIGQGRPNIETAGTYVSDIGYNSVSIRGQMHGIDNTDNHGWAYPNYNNSGHYDPGGTYPDGQSWIGSFQLPATGNWYYRKNGSIEGGDVTTSLNNDITGFNLGYEPLPYLRYAYMNFSDVFFWLADLDTFERTYVERFQASRFGIAVA